MTGEGESLFIFVPRKHVSALPADAIVHDVSSRAKPPFVKLSPFFPHGLIPVPGHPGKTSDSVEGIWQGLKVLTGAIDETYFAGKGKKRRGRPEGHLFEGRQLGYIEARRSIYLPAYTYLWRECIGRDLRRLFHRIAVSGQPQYFYDFESNGDVDDPSSPLAHASVLVGLLRGDFASGELAASVG
jgi:hypothetical protein